MIAPYDRERPLTIDSVTVSPWRMSSLGTWSATAIDPRHGVASWLIVRRLFESRRDLPVIMCWEWDARSVEDEPGRKWFGGSVTFEATPDAIDEALVDAMEQAENAVFSRYSLSAAFDGWQRPEVVPA